MTLLGRKFGTKFKVGDLVQSTDQFYNHRAVAILVDGIWDSLKATRFNPHDMVGIIIENDPNKLAHKLAHSKKGLLVVLFGEMTIFCYEERLVRVKRGPSRK